MMINELDGTCSSFLLIFFSSQVSYKILESGGQDYFYMNESIPGWVYTKKSLDYEKNSSYTLRVLAYDHGTPSQQASMDFEIAVEDVNEYQPVFKEKRYSFDMYGDMQIGSVIGNVSKSLTLSLAVMKSRNGLVS